MRIAQDEKTSGAEESFASLLAKSELASSQLAPGQKVKAKIVSISGDLAYIDLGGKSEGVIDLAEFRTEGGDIPVREGDEIEAFFVGVRDGVRKMTTLIHGYSAQSLAALKEAFDAGLPVTGEVKREVKGGFEVTAGGVRCFCPASQIDLKGGREGGLFLGRSFPFKVIELSENGRNVVLSRRALLDAERKAKISELKESLSVGMDITGKIRSIQKFGAFIDLGGVDGLIPASELSWERVRNVGDVLSVGSEVTARIIALDWEQNRLTLSLKAMQPDPWAGVADRYPVDTRISGTIVRLAPFGAFVNLEPGIDGLVHISNLNAGRKINHPKEVVEVGQVVEAIVQSVDPAGRKISLTMRPKAEPKKVVLPSVGEVLDGTVEKVMPFGVFVKLPGCVNGLVPNSEMATQHGADHKKLFPAGTEMKVVVVDVDQDAGKVRLSRKAAQDAETKAEYQEYVDSSRRESGASSGFGTLGDLLKAKLEEKNSR